MSGPKFLLLYLVIAVCANLFLRWYFRGSEESRTLPRLDCANDPYRVAYLRKGAEEAVRVAVFSLTDRGLLLEQGGLIRCAREDAGGFARRPIEQAILSCFAQWSDPKQAMTNPVVAAALADYDAALRQSRLLADAAVFSARFPAFAGVLAATLGIAVARIAYALAHGRTNVGFLIALAIGCSIALTVAYRDRQTGLGKATLRRMEQLFDRLKRRAASIAPGGASHDAAVLAAVFGLAALPATSFAFIERLYPKPKGGDSGGGCGGGGGCSGGCGGGCGGCGG